MQATKLIKAFGVYHALAALPLMLPVVSEHLLSILGMAHSFLGLGGQWLLINSAQMLFVNLFACVAFIWALVRVFHPTRILGIYEGCGMLLMSALVAYYVIQGASPVWLIIPLVDVPGGLLHLLFCRSDKKSP